MKCLAATILFLASTSAMADCAPAYKLEGNVMIKGCDRSKQACVDAAQAVHQYFENQPDDDNDFSIALSTSPWRAYDGDMRIIEVGELAALVRGQIKQQEQVVLMGSWTGVAPGMDNQSLAARLSTALDGFPVVGQDGFLWISKDGSLRTTQQAFTVRDGAGVYAVPEGGEVMIAMVAGWPSFLEETFVKDGNAYAVMRAGAGHDIFGLCPERALASFEAAARMGNPIAAYNAALMRLERGGRANMDAARALLARGAGLGDAKSAEKLESLGAP